MMQNNHSEKSFSKKIRDKGYYIVLLLCLAAVGVSGYLFCKSLADESKSNLNEDSLAVRETVAQTKASQPADAAEENMVQAVIGTQEESTTEAKAVKPTAVSPVSGDVVQTYSVDHLSYNVTTRDCRTHEGVDLQAALGDEVCAAADGTVDAVFSDDFLGQTVVICHENGYVTHYANLAEDVKVAVGDTVHAGDVIGAVGSTALLEVGADPHLHFEVYRNNVSIDPQSFLQ